MVWIGGEAHILTGRRRAPRLYPIVPVVRNGTQVAGSDVLAGLVRKLRRDDQGGDARGQCGGRQAAEILPTVELRERTLADDELRRGAHHHWIRVVVEAARDAQPPRQQDGQRDLVELCGCPVRRSVREPVLEPRTVCAL